MIDTVLHISLKKSDKPHSGPQAPGGDLQPLWIFYGPPTCPFLAPRGVFLTQNMLLVSDTGRNRVFIWRQLPTEPFQEPDVVLGQGDADGTGRNAGGEVNANTLQYPSGIWSDGVRLIVADAWNHRVLIWHNMPDHNAQAADVVLGQPDWNSNQPNANKVGSAPAANTLCWPYGVFSDGQQLWIADTGNRRVLYFKQIPQINFAAADGVIGKPDFETRDYEHRDPIWPYSVRVSPEGAMAVADTQYYRVLVWRNWQLAFQNAADLIIGQPDHDSSGQNQYGLYPLAHTLSWCYDSFFHRNGILVADTGNSRILCFHNLPSQNGAAANDLIGKPDFHTGSENAETVFGTDKGMYWPFSICADQDLLAVADTGNHRVLGYRLAHTIH